MTSTVLQSELANLIQESKRKDSDLRSAAEKSLNELKALPSTSESQLAADLIRRPHFVNPFLIACRSRNAKYAGIGVLCLQRLVSSKAISEERLSDVLDALKESTPLGLDVQLKTLQALPTLFQNYGKTIQGELLGSTLEICSTLQTNKVTAVSSTAAATFQQLVVSVFERVTEEDSELLHSITPYPADGLAASDVSPVATVPALDGSVQVRPAAYDAYRVLEDLCLYIESEKLQFLHLKSISPTFILELIENVLTNNAETFQQHPEQLQVLRERLMPLITKLLSDRLSFSITVRVARILFLLLKRHLRVLSRDCELALALLIHLLEPDAGSLWKRILSMEIFRGLYADYSLIRTIYDLYDKQEGRKNILRDHMAAMVRIASENPSLIGLSHQSTVPISHGSGQDMVDEQAALEAAGAAGVIGAPVSAADSGATGISSQWSNIRSPCIDQLDKSEPQAIPDTYIYTLILNTITLFSEGLAKFVLPLTVPSEGRGKRRHRAPTSNDPEPNLTSSPVESGILQRTDSSRTDIQSTTRRLQIPQNPLELDSHPQLDSIQTSASIIDSVWPAVLATCSTFLNAALDSDFYHNLVRSFQKLAHVAGLLRLSTPRDALLTTLGKAAVPTDVFAATSVPPVIPGLETPSSDRKYLTVDSPVAASPAQQSLAPRRSFEERSSSLSTRNLLCLRALLNLGIALGPTLDETSWSILLETLQQADLVIVFSMRQNARQKALSNPNEEGVSDTEQIVSRANLGNEVVAVETASTRMFESTSDYPPHCFLHILNALLKLSGHFETSLSANSKEIQPSAAPKIPTTPKRPPGRMHQSARSISISRNKTKVENDEMRFVLTKSEQLFRANIARFALSKPEEAGWNLVLSTMIDIAHSTEVESVSRLKAVEVLNLLVLGSMKAVISEDSSFRSDVQLRGLETLRREAVPVGAGIASANKTTELEIHDLVLAALKSVLEQCGESLVAGWEIVFELICSVFDATSSLPGTLKNGDSTNGTQSRRRLSYASKSPKLVRTAFSSLQLVGSDFLELLPSSCLPSLIECLPPFCLQPDDFNISLTTTNFFWNVSDFLQENIDKFTLDANSVDSVEESALEMLAEKNKDTYSNSALWLLLLLRMKVVTSDRRLEVRNGAVHTLYRIFDANGQKLSPSSWNLCLTAVLFPMLEIGQKSTMALQQPSKNRDSTVDPGWKDTSVVMIKGFANLFSSFLEAIAADSSFIQSWDRLLKFFRSVLDMRSLDLNTAVFSAIDEILTQVEEAEILGDRPLQIIWKLWDDANPAHIALTGNADSNNQDMISAYLDTYKNLYRLTKRNLNPRHVNSITQNLWICAWKSSHARYVTDINQVTAVQKSILDALKAIISDIDGSQSLVLNCLANFAESAFTRAPPEPNAGKPTFIAIAKASADLLDWCITCHGIREDIFTNGSLSNVLVRLSTPITNKYSWKGQDKAPPMWQCATTASLNILSTSIPYISRLAPPQSDHITKFWSQIITIATGILSADCALAPSSSAILSDQAFDTTSFLRLHALTVPALGSPSIPDSLRAAYTQALFTASLIHSPHRHDIPPCLSSTPLSNLHSIRMGRVIDPPPTPRTEISYTCLSTLFSLVASPSTQTPQTISLGRAAAPYLILRSALSIKSYIADQPLRGLMPQPLSQRKELLFILKKLVELRSEDDAIPARGRRGGANENMDGNGRFGASGEWKGKKHLWWVVGLVERAVGVAGRDGNGEVLGGLRGVLAALSWDDIGAAGERLG